MKRSLTTTPAATPTSKHTYTLRAERRYVVHYYYYYYSHEVGAAHIVLSIWCFIIVVVKYILCLGVGVAWVARDFSCTCIAARLFFVSTSTEGSRSSTTSHHHAYRSDLTKYRWDMLISPLFGGMHACMSGA